MSANGDCHILIKHGAPMLVRTLITGMALAALSGKAAASCEFVSKQPIMCATGTNAVLAYKHYGDNVAAIQTEHAKNFLRTIGCGSPFDPGVRAHRIEQLSSGKVYLPDSSETVLFLEVDGKYDGYVHAAYVRGACERHTPSIGIPQPPDR